MPPTVTSAVPFAKYQALGNDYLVIEPGDLRAALTPRERKRICDRHYGVGSDGILLGPLETSKADFGVRILNPDGTEAEKSGNGLRIFSRYLWDQGMVGGEPFTIWTLGGIVTSQVHPGGRQVTVEMGPVSFDSRQIPVEGPPREVLNESILVAGQELCFSAATIGNPHCVILCEEVSAEDAQHLGPLIEVDPRFPNRTNVQFMKVLDRANLRIEIWERAAGYTLASGSSSCAAAAVAYRLGFCDHASVVHMPGGQIYVSFDENMVATMTGAVSQVCSGFLSSELFEGAASP